MEIADAVLRVLLCFMERVLFDMIILRYQSREVLTQVSEPCLLVSNALMSLTLYCLARYTVVNKENNVSTLYIIIH